MSDAMDSMPLDLEGRRVLLGVSSSIAVYRSLDIVSQLVKRGARVQVIMTEEAAEIVRPIAFETLSRQRAVTSLWDRPHAYEMEHLEWTKWAEVMVVAPATGNVIGKLAHGIADDALTTAVLAWPGPLLIAPAMNPTMWQNPIVQENVESLRGRGVEFIGPVVGSTACGDVGEGRMASVEAILNRVVARLMATEAKPVGGAKPASESGSSRGSLSPLRGQRVLVTSGPTREFLDPVRYLSNPSSGKMGHAIAAEAVCRGASVVLVHGPVTVPPPPGLAESVAVTTAREMYNAVVHRAPGIDIGIFAAAVSDWRPAEPSDRKLKKESVGESIEVRFVRNPDIAGDTAELMPPSALRVGFAAETHDHLENAETKRRAKRFDLLVANNVAGSEGAFASEDNEAWILSEEEGPLHVARRSKAELASLLCDRLEELILARSGQARAR